MQGEDGAPGVPGLSVKVSTSVCVCRLAAEKTSVQVFACVVFVCLQGDPGDPGPEGLLGPAGLPGARVSVVVHSHGCIDCNCFS